MSENYKSYYSPACDPPPPQKKRNKRNKQKRNEKEKATDFRKVLFPLFKAEGHFSSSQYKMFISTEGR